MQKPKYNLTFLPSFATDLEEAADLEDAADLALFQAAKEEYENDPVTFTLDEVEEELGL